MDLAHDVIVLGKVYPLMITVPQTQNSRRRRNTNVSYRNCTEIKTVLSWAWFSVPFTTVSVIFRDTFINDKKYEHQSWCNNSGIFVIPAPLLTPLKPPWRIMFGSTHVLSISCPKWANHYAHRCLWHQRALGVKQAYAVRNDVATMQLFRNCRRGSELLGAAYLFRWPWTAKTWRGLRIQYGVRMDDTTVQMDWLWCDVRSC
jgi:hypothetical protein